MANGASLVPSISPILQSLQQFTPQAKRQEQERLAGLEQKERLTEAQITGTEQRSQLLEAQIKTEQRKLKLAQGIDTGNQAIRMFDDELLDIGQVTAGGSENLANNINKLMAEKGADSPDLAELVEFRNKAATDPEGTFNELLAEKEKVTNVRRVTLEQVNRLQGRLKPQFQARSFKPTEFKNGTTVTFDTAGQRVVRDGSGNILTGGEAQIAVDAGVESGITLAGVVAGTKTAANAAIARSEKAFDNLTAIRKNMLNLDEAIGLVQEGAGTGPIEKFFPSFRQASVKLQNLQGRLGLDVVGATTFGALSESELKFALNTALPLGLDGPDLIKWLQDKKAAQQKVANNLEELASFLGVPGNTTAKFLELKRSQRQQPGATTQPGAAQTGQPGAVPTTQQAPITISDAQGNRLQLINNQWVPLQ